MAELNPNMQAQGEGGFTGYSRGQIADTSGGGLFQDLNQATTAGIQGANAIITQNIRNDVTSAADEIRDTTINRLGGPPEGATPEEVESYRRNVTALQQSRRAGVLSDSHYWAQLDVETRRIRQKYPGHRHVVDQIMQDVVGATPANRLIAELQQELQGRKTNEQREYEYWLKQATTLGAPSAVNYAARARQGNPPSLLELQHESAIIQRQQASTQAEKQELELQNVRGQRDTRRAVSSAQRELYSRASNIYATGSGAVQDFNRRVEEFRTGRVQATPEQLQALSQMFDTQIRRPMMNILDETLHGQREGGQTWNTLIGDNNQTQNIEKTYTDFVNRLGESVGTGDWSMFTRLKTHLEAYQRGDVLTLLTDPVHGQTFRHLQGLREILGPQFYANSDFINRIPNMQQALRDVFAQGAEEDFATGGSLDERINRDRAVIRRDQIGDLTAHRIDNIVNSLAAPRINERGIVRYARQMFSDRNSQFLTNQVNNIPEVYQRIAGNKALHENMLRIKEIDPGLYSNYQRWIVEGFGHSMRQTAQAINDSMNFSGTSEGNIVFNPTTNRFVFSGPQSEQGTRTNVDNVNRAISGLTSYFEAQGLNPEEVRSRVAARVQSLNVDPNLVRRQGPWRQMLDQLQNFSQNFVSQGPVVGPLSSSGGQPEHYAPLLQRIMQGEAGQYGYNQEFNSQRLGAQNPELQNMTVGQVRQRQREIIAQQRARGIPGGEGPGLRRSSAIGAYQFTQETLDRAMRLAGVTENDRFDRRTQDRLATALLNDPRMGLTEYIRNPTERNLNRAVNNLSREWAALPNSMGVGMHDGIAGNRANVPLSDMKKILKGLAEQYSNN
jgi:hypothetical protein